MPTVDTSGGSVTPRSGILVEIPADVFTDVVGIQAVDHPDMEVGPLADIGLFFDLFASYADSGLLASPSQTSTSHSR